MQGKLEKSSLLKHRRGLLTIHLIQFQSTCFLESFVARKFENNPKLHGFFKTPPLSSPTGKPALSEFLSIEFPSKKN